MIPRAALDAWRQQAPWPSEIDIEQDLVLSRLVVEFAQHPVLAKELAFRGGTCLHKLHADRAPRYSNDLDYVRATTGPIRDVMEATADIARAVGLDRRGYEQKQDAVIMRFEAAATGGVGQIRVKVEVNTRETQPFRERVHLPMVVANPWFRGEADVLTFRLEELLGTKMRALYQRRKGRDLFDLWFGLEHLGADAAEVVAAFRHYLDSGEQRISRKDFERNVATKLQHVGFRTDLDLLIVTPPRGYDIDDAGQIVMQRLVALLD